MKTAALLSLCFGFSAVSQCETPPAGPLSAIERAHPAALSADLAGVHPRLFLTQAEIDSLKVKIKNDPQRIVGARPQQFDVPHA